MVEKADPDEEIATLGRLIEIPCITGWTEVDMETWPVNPFVDVRKTVVVPDVPA
jgi:hypothetical protein